MADPEKFDTDPDPIFYVDADPYLDTDPDSIFYVDADSYLDSDPNFT